LAIVGYGGSRLRAVFYNTLDLDQFIARLDVRAVVLVCVGLALVLIGTAIAGYDPRGLVVAGLIVVIGATLVTLNPAAVRDLDPRQVFRRIDPVACLWLSMAGALVVGFAVGILWRRLSRAKPDGRSLATRQYPTAPQYPTTSASGGYPGAATTAPPAGAPQE
jgi:hypothetical protein